MTPKNKELIEYLFKNPAIYNAYTKKELIEKADENAKEYLREKIEKPIRIYEAMLIDNDLTDYNMGELKAYKEVLALLEEKE